MSDKNNKNKKGEINVEPIEKLRKDLRQAAATLSLQEIRYLVDLYYQIQDFRKAAENQVNTLGKGGELVNVLSWAFGSMETIENEIKYALNVYTNREPTGMGSWAKSICGIGPVLSAGLLAYINVEKAPTAGHVWRFAGLDPTLEWLGKEKSQKLVHNCRGENVEATLAAVCRAASRSVDRIRRAATTDANGKTVKLTEDRIISVLSRRPWNASLKVLCWKIGESFVKVSANENDTYGKVWINRKEYETEKNELGDYANQCPGYLGRLRDKNTPTYKTLQTGMLPAGILHARSKRYAVKLFLAHWWEESYRRHFKKEPPLPYPIAHLGHTHKI